MSRLFAIHDNSEELKQKGAFEITKSDIKVLNSQGYGIFFIPNEFEGARKIENCKKVNFWIADIDEGTKEEMLESIKKLILKPSQFSC